MSAAMFWTDSPDLCVDDFPSWYSDPADDDPWGDEALLHVAVVDLLPDDRGGRTLALVRYTPRPGQMSALAEILLGGNFETDEDAN
jgi:hypothetical protein